MCCCCQIKKLRKDISVGLSDVARQLEMFRFVQSKPGLVKLHILREENGMPFFALTLPPVIVSQRVTTREMIVALGVAEPILLSPAVDAIETEELGPLDYLEHVTGELTDIDSVGNRSLPRMFDLVVTDTIAPSQPGEVGIRITREE